MTDCLMPAGFNIITSNKLERLAVGLAELLHTGPEGRTVDPFQKEWVLVQSKGMQRWLSLSIANLNGICANIEFPFPNTFLNLLYERLIGPLPSSHPFDQQYLTFRIFQELPHLLPKPEFAPLRSYLANGVQSVKLYQLSGKLSDTFDQYAVFRPDMLSEWDTNQAPGSSMGENGWQVLLWRQLTAKRAEPHRATVQRQLVERLASMDELPESASLPSRLSIFGISHLPPFHIEALKALSGSIPVYLFLLNPCRHYWFDILSDHEIVRFRSNSDRPVKKTEDLHLVRGNRLLASMGHLGKQFFDMVYQHETFSIEDFEDNSKGSLLGRIQQDILDLEEPTGSANGKLKSSFEPDGTLSIHSCHSAMREVEVLHDQILSLFADDPALRPRDILVMAPDVGQYAPYVHAVFGTREINGEKIPYDVTDQSVLHESPLITGFIQLLEMVDSRFKATRVLSLLECPAIQRRFGLISEDMSLMERWVHDSGIRWGWDGADRKRQDLPGDQANTWRVGLDRLMLGFALSSDENRLFAEILPFSHIGAGQGETAGRLTFYVETLRDSVVRLRGSDTIAGWHLKLHQLVNLFFDPADADSGDMQALTRIIDDLERFADVFEPSEIVSHEVIFCYLKENLKKISYDSGFISGGITFCAMLPMRSIPAKVICLLGMNHDAYPREHHEPGFNLIAAAPRIGDRSKRHDDRYLFIETLISVRQALYISFVGQSIQDNMPIPPSVLVDELIEYLSEGYGIDREQIVTRHPLHAFSPGYFDGGQPRLFSYSKEDWAAAERSLSPPMERRFFHEALAPPTDEWRMLEWRQVCDFFAHPVRFLLANRLGLHLRSRYWQVEDREQFVPDSLVRYQLHQRLLKHYLAGETRDNTFRAVRAAQVLPHGMAGELVFEQLSDEVVAYLSGLLAHTADETPKSVQLELKVDDFLLNGTIDGIYTAAHIKWRMGKMRPQDLLSTFIEHLGMLSADATEALPDTSLLICDDSIWQFGAVENPRRTFAEYLSLFWAGLQQPLPFFCRTSFAYAQQILIRNSNRHAAMNAAEKIWHGNDFQSGESQDPYLFRCFGTRDVLDEGFEKMATAVFGPIFATGSRLAAGG